MERRVSLWKSFSGGRETLLVATISLTGASRRRATAGPASASAARKVAFGKSVGLGAVRAYSEGAMSASPGTPQAASHLEPARHPEVHQERLAGGQRNQQVLPTALDRQRRRPGDALGKPWRKRRAQVRPADQHALEALARHRGLPASPVGLSSFTMRLTDMPFGRLFLKVLRQWYPFFCGTARTLRPRGRATFRRRMGSSGHGSIQVARFSRAEGLATRATGRRRNRSPPARGLSTSVRPAQINASPRSRRMNRLAGSRPDAHGARSTSSRSAGDGDALRLHALRRP